MEADTNLNNRVMLIEFLEWLEKQNSIEIRRYSMRSPNRGQGEELGNIERDDLAYEFLTKMNASAEHE